MILVPIMGTQYATNNIGNQINITIIWLNKWIIEIINCSEN